MIRVHRQKRYQEEWAFLTARTGELQMQWNVTQCNSMKVVPLKLGTREAVDATNKDVG